MEEDSFFDTAEFQKMFGHDPGKDKEVLRLALIGYPGVGKSAFIKRFCDQAFPANHIPSMNTELSSEVIRVASSVIIEVFLYEVAGQTQYIEIRNLFVCGIQGIILMFAHHYPYSFEKITYLHGFIHKYLMTKVPILLIGNSFEGEEILVTVQQANELAQKLGVTYRKIDVKRSLSCVDKSIGFFINIPETKT